MPAPRYWHPIEMKAPPGGASKPRQVHPGNSLVSAQQHQSEFTRIEQPGKHRDKPYKYQKIKIKQRLDQEATLAPQRLIGAVP